MLILISGTYCAIVWLVFFKLDLLPWNKKTRGLSIAVGVVLIVGILIGLYQGSPGSVLPITTQSRVVQISSQVSGRVVKVHVNAGVPIKKGDPLFAVDPQPYQNEVDRLEAQLQQAIAGVDQMKATLAAAQAAVQSAQEQLQLAQKDWERNDAEVKAANETAEANARAIKAQLDMAILERDRQKILLDKARISQSDYDVAAARVESLTAQQDAAKETIEQTALSGRRQTDTRRATLDTAEATLMKTKADEAKATAALSPMVDGEHTSVRQVREALKTAKFNLDNTVTYAPSHGFVTTLALTEGSFVRVTPVMSFVSTESVMVAVQVAQNTAQHIKPGHAAEVALKAYPGVILTGKVYAMSYATGEAQVAPGNIAMGNQALASNNAWVRLDMDDDPDHPIEFGMTGSAAIYTDTAQPFAIIRKIILRMNSLKYFLF